MKPVYPTIPTAHTFQGFGNINWKLYGRTDGKHMGIDIGVDGGKPGAPIYAVLEGKVVECGYYEQGGYGRRVVLEHEGGQFQTLYAHLKTIVVKLGDMISTGQLLGEMGGNIEDKFRGASSGTHLHFEVIVPIPVNGSIKTFKGYTVDPFPFLLERYFPGPINYGEVVSKKGMFIRSRPEVTKDALKVGVANYRDRIKIMEVQPRSGGAQWARLWSLREEWIALEYDAVPLMKLDQYTPPPPPIPEPEPTENNSEYQRGYADAVTKMSDLLRDLMKLP